MAQHALDAVEPRLAHPGGQAADGGLRDAADAVVRVPRGENLAADRLTRRRIECGEGGLAQRGDVRGGVGKGTVPRFTAAENVCADRDAAARSTVSRIAPAATSGAVTRPEKCPPPRQSSKPWYLQ